MNDGHRRLLPPMAMLHSFVAAARHGSFSRAAIEIGLTQGAVSRQVAALEEWLGRRLFDRLGRRVTLNEDGRRYADAVEGALAGIRRATRQAIERPRERVVTLATLPGFGMRWLAPRLPRLAARHPDMIINLAARSDEFSFADTPFDAAIHFGAPDWPGVKHDFLFHEISIPVMAPGLAASLTTPADLARLPLLVLGPRRDAWQAVFARLGLGAPPAPIASFEQFMMLAQAAVAGSGAAIIPRFLIEPELAAGTLVAPFDVEMPGVGAYYLVYSEPADLAGGLSDLRDWLFDEVAMLVHPKLQSQ